MKIGILTHHYVNNYGAFLQAYALRETLAQAFPRDRVEVIDYINIKQFVINTGGWFRFYKDRENLRCWTRKIRVPQVFWKARKEHLTRSAKCCTTRQVNRLHYDVIVVGSDEVWNYKDKRSTARIKFAQGLTCDHVIAYAPSVGNSQGDTPQYVLEGLRRFAALSARDEKTAELVQEATGTAPVKVLDPTFLTDLPVKKTRAAEPYILFYYCDRLPSAIKAQILDYAREHGMAVYGAGECDKRYTDITVDLTPFEWVEMFRNAAFVFTGTFHGAVFSVLNHRPFKVFLTNKSRIEKVGSLLADCGIENREIGSDFVFDLEAMAHEIDYDAVDRILAEKREKSMNYLIGAVMGCRKQKI